MAACRDATGCTSAKEEVSDEKKVNDETKGVATTAVSITTLGRIVTAATSAAIIEVKKNEEATKLIDGYRAKRMGRARTRRFVTGVVVGAGITAILASVFYATTVQRMASAVQSQLDNFKRGSS